MRALEVQAAAAITTANGSGSEAHNGAEPVATSAARAALAEESRQPCKLRMRVAQVKADLIRQREIELLLPAAGPGASEVLRLLRPATTETPMGAPPVAVDYQQLSPLPFSEPAAAVAATAFNAEGATTPVSSETATASDLMGLSCTIGSDGEVCIAPM